MHGIEIARVTLKDLARLKELSERTFTETFAPMNTAANLSAYLAHEFAKDKLEHELGDPDSQFHFALFEEQVVGYLKVNMASAQTELRDQNTLEIERIYVVKELHGRKVGQALLDKAFAIACEKGADHVWLGVWEANTKAIRFYEKNGFLQFAEHIFMLGTDAQTDIMMKADLATFAASDKDRAHPKGPA